MADSTLTELLPITATHASDVLYIVSTADTLTGVSGKIDVASLFRDIPTIVSTNVGISANEVIASYGSFHEDVSVTGSLVVNQDITTQGSILVTTGNITTTTGYISAGAVFAGYSNINGTSEATTFIASDSVIVGADVIATGDLIGASANLTSNANIGGGAYVTGDITGANAYIGGNVTGTNSHMSGMMTAASGVIGNLVQNQHVVEKNTTFTLTNIEHNSKIIHCDTMSGSLSVICGDSLTDGFNVGLMNLGTNYIYLSSSRSPMFAAIGNRNNEIYTSVFVYKHNNNFYAVGTLS